MSTINSGLHSSDGPNASCHGGADLLRSRSRKSFQNATDGTPPEGLKAIAENRGAANEHGHDLLDDYGSEDEGSSDGPGARSKN